MSFETNRETRNCERHGDYQATLTSLALGSGPKIRNWSTSRCPRCAEEAEQEERARRIAQAKQWTHIPARFWDCSFDNYIASTQQQQHALRVARGYAENFAEVRKAGHNVTFCGTCGTGKTHLGIAVLNHIIEAGAESGHISLSSFRYTTVHDVIRDIRETWRHHSDAKETALVQSYRDLSLLVLDEVGASMGGEGGAIPAFPTCWMGDTEI
jgi:DNA replication protein DnaC